MVLGFVILKEKITVNLVAGAALIVSGVLPVSYTHLTLPTSDLV